MIQRLNLPMSFTGNTTNVGYDGYSKLMEKNSQIVQKETNMLLNIATPQKAPVAVPMQGAGQKLDVIA